MPLRSSCGSGCEGPPKRVLSQSVYGQNNNVAALHAKTKELHESELGRRRLIA